jgi:signal transduction histidine kinase
MCTTQSARTNAAGATPLSAVSALITQEVIESLTSIMLTAEANLRWLARPEPDLEKVRELTKRMIDDARRAADIIDGMRTIAPRETPKNAS